MSTYPPPAGSGAEGRRAEPPQNIATAIAEVSERATLLVHEEIELAKAEVSEKANKLIRGAIVGAAAGIFIVTALMFLLIGCAWLIYWALPVGTFDYFWGFFAMAAILVLLGVLAGLIAARAVKRGAPPVPTMAIEEARKIREAVSGPPSAPAAPGSGSGSGPAYAKATPAPPVAAPAPAPPVAAAPPAPPPPDPAPAPPAPAAVDTAAVDTTTEEPVTEEPPASSADGEGSAEDAAENAEAVATSAESAS
jgi:uncharacterized membrane protein YqjE